MTRLFTTTYEMSICLRRLSCASCATHADTLKVKRRIAVSGNHLTLREIKPNLNQKPKTKYSSRRSLHFDGHLRSSYRITVKFCLTALVITYLTFD